MQSPKEFDEGRTERMDFASPFARTAQLAMADGDHDRAVRAILDHQHQRAMEEEQLDYSCSLALCGVPTRMVNELEKLEVFTVGDLADVGLDVLLSQPNVGQRMVFDAMQQVIRALAPRRGG